MDQLSELKTGEYVEWRTDQLLFSPGVMWSPHFTFQGCDWRLMLCGDHGRSFYAVRLERLTPNLPFRRITVTTHCRSLSEHNIAWFPTCVRTITENLQAIWDAYISLRHVGSEGMTFLLVFHRDAEYVEVTQENPTQVCCPHSEGWTANPCTGSWTVNPCTDSLVQDLQKLMEEDSHHDLELRCGDSSIRAHTTILSARSTVFAAMLRTDMQEGRSGVVDIADMEFPVLQHFVRYVYCGKLPELTVELASHLFKVGDKYDVGALMKRCAEFLVENLTVDNACACLALADDHGDRDFKESVVSFILDMKVPKEYSGWIEFCRSRPMLSLEVLNRYVFKN